MSEGSAEQEPVAESAIDSEQVAEQPTESGAAEEDAASEPAEQSRHSRSSSTTSSASAKSPRAEESVGSTPRPSSAQQQQQQSISPQAQQQSPQQQQQQQQQQHTDGYATALRGAAQAAEQEIARLQALVQERDDALERLRRQVVRMEDDMRSKDIELASAAKQLRKTQQRAITAEQELEAARGGARSGSLSSASPSHAAPQEVCSRFCYALLVHFITMMRCDVVFARSCECYLNVTLLSQDRPDWSALFGEWSDQYGRVRPPPSPRLFLSFLSVCARLCVGVRGAQRQRRAGAVLLPNQCAAPVASTATLQQARVLQAEFSALAYGEARITLAHSGTAGDPAQFVCLMPPLAPLCSTLRRRAPAS